MDTGRPDAETLQAPGCCYEEIVDRSEDVERGPDMGLLWGVVVAGDYDSGNTALCRQPVQLLGSPGHDTVQGADRMEQIARMYAYIGPDCDNTVDRIDESGENVFLPFGQSARRATPMVLACTQMTIREVTQSHNAQYTVRRRSRQSQWVLN